MTENAHSVRINIGGKKNVQMVDILIKLKKIGVSRYALFGPNGNQISGVYQGSIDHAKEWAKTFCSSWHGWHIDYKEIDDEEATRVSK